MSIDKILFGAQGVWGKSEGYPAVSPYEEFEKYRGDLLYYRNIANEGVNVFA